MSIDFDKPITRADVKSKPASVYNVMEAKLLQYDAGGNYYVVFPDGTGWSLTRQSLVKFKNAPEITHRFRNEYEGDTYRSGPWQDNAVDAALGMSSSKDYLYTLKETYEDGVRVKVEIVTL